MFFALIPLTPLKIRDIYVVCPNMNEDEFVVLFKAMLLKSVIVYINSTSSHVIAV
jgi:hypothetical protein